MRLCGALPIFGSLGKVVTAAPPQPLFSRAEEIFRLGEISIALSGKTRQNFRRHIAVIRNNLTRPMPVRGSAQFSRRLCKEIW